MTFHPKPGATLDIEGKIYRIAEHPMASGMPYGQEGRRAVVYQLLDEDGEKYALKVFKARFRVPGMVSVAETLEPYASLEGLQACQRIVLTGSRHPELLRIYPELTYAVLMPWVEGPTWQEMLLEPGDISLERSLEIARAFSKLLMILEEKRLAHCDLSGANLIIQPGDIPALVDLEEMYGPDFVKPESLPAGSPGYAHKTAPRGLWNPTTDRFPGALLITEMLCWHDPAVREAAWGESYFAPKDMQTENKRLDVLTTSLKTNYGQRILDLFNQAWRSDSLRDCPTFAEWAVALPMEVEQQDPIKITEAAEDERLPAKNDTAAFILNAQKAAAQGENDQAISWYRKAIALAPPELSGEIEKRIKDLDNLEAEQMEDQQAGKKDEENPARPCPVCGEQIPAGQEICPYCEGKPKARQDQPSVPGGKYLKMKLLASGIGLIAILGIILIVLGWGGSGPLSSLEISKQAPTGTAISNLIPSATQLPTETPTPTETLIPSQTPTPTLGVGSAQLSAIDGMAMMYIPAGKFLMGSDEGEGDESPVHEVYLDAFWMDEHEVTWGQYQKFLEETGYDDSASGESEDHPVIYVDWDDTQAYCEWAGRRLPTEAEWEKAARGGLEGKKYPWGNEDPVCSQGAENGAQFISCDDRTVPVMSFFPNGYGLYDMAGNLWEWVSDYYDSGYYENSPVENPQGPASGNIRVLRGGSWNDYASCVVAAIRHRYDPNDSSDSRGFRCADPK